MPLKVLQRFHIGVMKEIRLHIQLECRELIKVSDEKEKKQQKYTTALQEKREVEEKFDRMIKEKNEAKEKTEKVLKEKNRAEEMELWIQTVIQKLYKEIPEVPMVVEAIMEEHISRIGEAIKGIFTRIEDLKSHSTLRTPPEEREERERIAITMVVNIKKLDKECVKFYEESSQIWMNLMEDPEMEDIESKLRDV
jgi:hypothetical protein